MTSHKQYKLVLKAVIIKKKKGDEFNILPGKEKVLRFKRSRTPRKGIVFLWIFLSYSNMG